MFALVALGLLYRFQPNPPQKTQPAPEAVAQKTATTVMSPTPVNPERPLLTLWTCRNDPTKKHILKYGEKGDKVEFIDCGALGFWDKIIDGGLQFVHASGADGCAKVRQEVAGNFELDCSPMDARSMEEYITYLEAIKRQ